MKSIDVKVSGDFHGIERFFATIKRGYVLNHLDKYGRMGVEALSAATPVDTGKTAASWSYEIRSTDGHVTISWTNSNNAGNCAIIGNGNKINYDKKETRQCVRLKKLSV